MAPSSVDTDLARPIPLDLSPAGVDGESVPTLDFLAPDLGVTLPFNGDPSESCPAKGALRVFRSLRWDRAGDA